MTAVVINRSAPFNNQLPIAERPPSLTEFRSRSVFGFTGGEQLSLQAGGRSGLFEWVPGNQTASVAADPQQGMWIAPTSAPSGSLGAWERVVTPFSDGWVNVEWFGAVGNTVRRAAASMTAGSAIITSGGFTSSRIGNRISIEGAGVGGASLETTIVGVTNSTTATLAAAASTTVSNVPAAFGTPDGVAFQAALDWVASTDANKQRRGKVRFGAKVYWIETTLQLTSGGQVLEGVGKERVGGTASVNNGGVLLGASTSNPVIGLWSAQTTIQDVEIGATPGRRTAALSRSPRGSNCGISIETIDTSNAAFSGAVIKNTLIRDQPADGCIMSGYITSSLIEDLSVQNCGGHGLFIEGGGVIGRTNISTRPGIGVVNNFFARDNGGHGLAIGNKFAQQQPFRFKINNSETLNNGLNPAVRFEDTDGFIHGQQLMVETSAFSGFDARPPLTVAGQDNGIYHTRFVEAAGSAFVLIKTYFGVTRCIKIIGGIAFSSSTLPVFALADSTCRQIEIDGVAGYGAYTDLFSPLTLKGLRLTDYNLSSSDSSLITKYVDAPQDFSQTTLIYPGGAPPVIANAGPGTEIAAINAILASLRTRGIVA